MGCQRRTPLITKGITKTLRYASGANLYLNLSDLELNLAIPSIVLEFCWIRAHYGRII